MSGSVAALPTETPDQAQPPGPGRPNLVTLAGEAVALPANLQSPAMELSKDEVDRAVSVFERSLAFLRGLFSNTPVLVVYVPSPLSSYELIGPEMSVQSYMVDRESRYSKEQVTQSSAAICELIRAASVRQGAGFLDGRSAILSVSSKELVHGPRDFKHFNHAGMNALGRAIAAQVERPLTQDVCSGRAS
jgi:hypothetical protein